MDIDKIKPESGLGPLWFQSVDNPDVWHKADAQWSEEDGWHWITPPGTWRIMPPPTVSADDCTSTLEVGTTPSD